MRFKMIISLILLTLFLLKCTIDDRGEPVSENLKQVDFSSYSTLPPFIIKLERGAFHYDTFTLVDSVLAYTPEDNIEPEQENIFSNPIVVIITKEQREELVNFINNENFWSLKEHYQAQSSCTSGITISIELGNKHKTIISDDYKRDCPESLYQLEQKLIEFTGKDLERVYLPG